MKRKTKTALGGTHGFVHEHMYCTWYMYYVQVQKSTQDYQLLGSSEGKGGIVHELVVQYLPTRTSEILVNSRKRKLQ